jgi:GntR family transcriptional regulator
MLQPVDPTSERPVYKQIADQLRAAIEAGTLPPGERLPSEAELMSRYDVAQGTVRQAISLLRGEGLVVAQHGAACSCANGLGSSGSPRTGSRASTGRRARPRIWPSRRPRASGRASRCTTSVPARPPPISPAGSVFARGARVLVRRRRYLSEGQPTELATSYIPWTLAKSRSQNRTLVPAAFTRASRNAAIGWPGSRKK